jgi:hypothetical protein
MKDVDRTYRENPGKFGRDLSGKITRDASEQLEEWRAKGKLPLWLRVKNRFSSNKVTLGDRK